ncbi:hypothetical protein H7J77_04910 [Mycolicibacillus parakoreensis]|uniref:Uncharacterized protein n=1 Tax=Mycolicibacillus parakoreensis TaxID=1069221 RepID=A0ABY3U548_9MYCO|nr:hypothetical protein [Mycolicibacillus parakoreensis]MCV7314878.1 hypothetical protein [Mycolicibacillus parakoreensis]ULN53872.1 hypothetical protein MIU77_06135 [Mycolicibacillus parakoreensis]
MAYSLQPVTRAEALARRRAAQTPYKSFLVMAALAGLTLLVALPYVITGRSATVAWTVVVVAAVVAVAAAVGARNAIRQMRYRIAVALAGLRLLAIVVGGVVMIWAMGQLAHVVGLTWGWQALKLVLALAVVAGLGYHLATSTLFIGDVAGLRFRATLVRWKDISEVVIAADDARGTVEIGAAGRDAPPTPMPVRDNEVLTDLPYRTVVRARSFSLDRLRWAMNQSGRDDIALVERIGDGERVLGHANRWT